MQAIETKYLGPSNVKGARIKATASAGSVTVGYDHALSLEANFRFAARALCAKFGWPLEFSEGTLPNGNQVFILNERP